MEGYFFKNDGGMVNGIDQVVGELHLPPGAYIVFASAHMAVASNSTYQPDTYTTAYRALLQFGGDENEVIGGLKWDFDDPGSRYESVALNVAAEEGSHARLLISSTSNNKVLCFDPRISAIPLDAVHITTKFGDGLRIPFEARIARSAILTGIPMDVLSKLFGS